MSMQLNNLTQSSGIKEARRVGRGGKRGKTSGRGGKGQTARAGAKIRPAERDIIKRLPKLRGHGKNRSRTVVPRVKPTSVNLNVLEQVFNAGDRVSPKELVALGVIRSISGKAPAVKILGTGSLTKKLHVSGCTYSATAKDAIVKVGGEVL